MANSRAIVAGPLSYLEIGAGSSATNYLNIGAVGVVGSSGNMAIYGDETGSGTDKTIVIGEQGALAATNVIHFFGTTSTLTVGTVKIHGNLEVDGTENVVGDATFNANATFEGDTTFGDSTADRVIFVADVDSDIYFDASAGGRTIGVRVPTTGVGTDLTISAGAAFGAGNDAGGNLLLLPANPTGTGAWGAVKAGSSSEIDPVDGKQGPRLFLNTGSPTEAGFRWNSTDSKFQWRTQNGAWTDFEATAVVNDGVNLYDHLEWNTATSEWDPSINITLNGTVGTDRTIKVVDGDSQINLSVSAQSAVSANTGGGALNLSSGSSTGTGTAGSILIQAGSAAGSGGAGDVQIQAGDSATGTSGNLLLNAGQGIDGGNTAVFGGHASGAGGGGKGGNVLVKAGNSIGAVGGDASLNATNGTGGNFAGGDAYVISGTGNGTAGGGAVYLTAGDGGVSNGAGGILYLQPGAPRGTGTEGYGLFGNSAILDPTLLFVSTDHTAPVPSQGPGFRYSDTNTRMEFCDDASGNWQPFAAGGSLPNGSVTGQVLSWNQTAVAWNVVNDVQLPAGQAGTRRVSLQDHTAATAAEAFVVSGQANTSAGPGTTTGGLLTVKGGDSTAENGGDLVLTGGIGNSNNGDVLFGDGTNLTNIDFENTVGNRVISNITFLNTGTGSSYTIKPDNANSTNANALLLGGAQGGVAATGGIGGATSVLGGIGGTNNAGGTSGVGGSANLLAGAGGAGLTGTAGNGGPTTVYAGDAGAVGTVAGGNGGNLSMKAGAGTGNGIGGTSTLTGGAAVGTAAAGGVDITGGANSSTGIGGGVNITGGASTGGIAGSVIIDAGAGTTAGGISIGGTNAGSVTIGIGANLFNFDTTSSPPVFSATGTATIDLPGTAAATNNFRIQGVAVADTVDAPNLDTLTAGPTSDASLLHTHTGLGAITVNSGEAITANMLVAAGYNGSNVAKGYQCDITSTPGGGADGPLPIGFATSSVAADTDVVLKDSGEVTVPAALWQVQPSVTDVGKFVYAYGTAGGVSLTAPTSGSGSYRTKVGVLKSVVATVSGTIAINIGDTVLMA